MRRIIILAVIALFLSGCAPKTEPAPPKCVISSEFDCENVAYDEGKFIFNIRNHAGFSIKEATMKVEGCEGEGYMGIVANKELRIFEVECSPGLDVFEGDIIFSYMMDGTKFLRMGKLTADMKHENFNK